MALLIFLLTVAVLGISIVAGYRLNMYLYAQGALGTNSRQVSSVGEDEGQSYDVSLLRVRDYGLGYARTGMLVFAILALVIVVSLIVVIATAV